MHVRDRFDQSVTFVKEAPKVQDVERYDLDLVLERCEGILLDLCCSLFEHALWRALGCVGVLGVSAMIQSSE
jgi:hypothetical protein